VLLKNGSKTVMRKKLLVVEDNSDLLELLRLAFKEAGYSVATAANGLEALKKIRSVAPDLVVLDLVLPELDGFAVCESLRHDPNFAAIPVIVLTGLSGEFTRYAGLEVGANEYVSKPVSPDQLLARVRYWLAHPPSPARPRYQPQPKLARGLSRVD
jgi:two-component system, OmpR family, alkaline phosphatase synthesis response regulator PhoP